MKTLSLLVQKLITKAKFALERQMDGQTDRVIPIYPETLFVGGIIIH